jgi:hypothetical protein
MDPKKYGKPTYEVLLDEELTNVAIQTICRVNKRSSASKCLLDLVLYILL